MYNNTCKSPHLDCSHRVGNLSRSLCPWQSLVAGLQTRGGLHTSQAPTVRGRGDIYCMHAQNTCILYMHTVDTMKVYRMD